MEITLSSTRRGYGLPQLLSEGEGEYWATNDTLPHFIHISFGKRSYVYAVALYFSFTADESYTPERVIVYTGNKVRKFAWVEPVGFKEMKIDEFVFDIYVVIENNHSDGRDSHVRGLKILTSPPHAEHGEDSCRIR